MPSSLGPAQSPPLNAISPMPPTSCARMTRKPAAGNLDRQNSYTVLPSLTRSVALIWPPFTETALTLVPGGTGKPAGNTPGSPATGAGVLLRAPAAALGLVPAGAGVAAAVGDAGASVPPPLPQPASASTAAASTPVAAVREVIGGPFDAAVGRSNRTATTRRRASVRVPGDALTPLAAELDVLAADAELAAGHAAVAGERDRAERVVHGHGAHRVAGHR